MITGLIPVILLMAGLLGYLVYDIVKMGRNIRKIRKQLKRL